MGGAPAATLCRTSAKATTSVGPGNTPKGLSGSGLHTPAGALFAGGPRSIHRQYTMCKSRPGELQQTQALPFMLDLTLALVTDMQPPSIVQSSLDEVVFQATLQVPAHHALSCKLQAYGTPFAAPNLQATVAKLSDADLEFAACLASPPDLDEQMSMNIGRVMSMLERNRAEPAGPVGRTAAAQAQAPGVSNQQVSAAQQLRGAGGVQQSTAPKVLVSVDDAEAGASHLQRSNSTRKASLPQMPGFARRAMQALLGFGYLLTVLHEKHLGGHIEFTASALTAANTSTPGGVMGDSHVRTLRNKSSSGRSGGMMKALRQMIQECPSLSPIRSVTQQQPQSLLIPALATAGAAGAAGRVKPAVAAAAAAASAARGFGSPFASGAAEPATPSSFPASPAITPAAAAAERAAAARALLGKSASTGLAGGPPSPYPVPATPTPTPAAAGAVAEKQAAARAALEAAAARAALELTYGNRFMQSTLTSPVNSFPSTPAATPAAPAADRGFDRVWERISSISPGSGRQPVRGLALQLSLSPINRMQSTIIERNVEQQGHAVLSPTACPPPPAPTPAASSAASAAAAMAQLRATSAHGHSGNLEQLLNDALGHLAEQQPQSPIVLSPLQSPTNSMPKADSSSDTVGTNIVPVRAVQIYPAAGDNVSSGGNSDALKSHYLPDQDNLTSPWPSSMQGKAPWLVLASPKQAGLASDGLQMQHSVGSAAVSGAPSPYAVTPTPASTPAVSGAAAEPGSPVAMTPRVLKPMLSMRLYSIMSPKWQYSQELEDLRQGAGAASAGSSGGQQEQQHEGEVLRSPGRGYAGIWPTVSFSLAPVRLHDSAQQQQQQVDLSTSS